jgi:hypothetical protein
MQYKIPQEVNVEDKIVGPFTLKGFSFVMGFTLTAIVFAFIFSSVGLGLIPSTIVGCFFGSSFLIVGFVPFNGKPLYQSSEAFISYLFKPRKRVWNRVDDIVPKRADTQVKPSERTETITPNVESVSEYTPTKEPLENMEGKIEKISLMVDTGGAYDQNKRTGGQPADMFSSGGKGTLDSSLEKARNQVESINNQEKEPTISNIASVDPNKKFDYEKADTSGYKIEKE